VHLVDWHQKTTKASTVGWLSGRSDGFCSKDRSKPSTHSWDNRNAAHRQTDSRAFKYDGVPRQTMWALTPPQVAATLAARLVASGTRIAAGTLILDARMLNAVLVLMLVTSILGPPLVEQFAPRMLTNHATEPADSTLHITPACASIRAPQALTDVAQCAPSRACGLLRTFPILHRRLSRFSVVQIVRPHSGSCELGESLYAASIGIFPEFRPYDAIHWNGNDVAI
jgi:hypothetical protein